jgi:hypothetical protein
LEVFVVETVQLAAVLAVVVVLASMISVELGLSVAHVELGLGVAAGNLFDLDSGVCVPHAVLLPARRVNVSLGAVFANLGLLSLLFASKMLPKIGLILPLARRSVPRHATFTTLLMSTGLTFGTISSLYGLNAGVIDRTSSRC